MELEDAEKILRNAVRRIRTGGVDVKDAGCGCCGSGVILAKGKKWAEIDIYPETRD